MNKYVFPKQIILFTNNNRSNINQCKKLTSEAYSLLWTINSTIGFMHPVSEIRFEEICDTAANTLHAAVYLLEVLPVASTS